MYDKLTVTDEALASADYAWVGEELFELTNAQLQTVLTHRGVEYADNDVKRELVKRVLDDQAAKGTVAKPQEDETSEEGKMPEEDENAKIAREVQLNEARQKEEAEAQNGTQGLEHQTPYSAPRTPTGNSDVVAENAVAAASVVQPEETVTAEQDKEATQAALKEAVKVEVKAATAQLEKRLAKAEQENAELRERLDRKSTLHGSIADLGKTPGFEEEAPANGVQRRTA